MCVCEHRQRATYMHRERYISNLLVKKINFCFLVERAGDEVENGVCVCLCVCARAHARERACMVCTCIRRRPSRT